MTLWLCRPDLPERRRRGWSKPLYATRSRLGGTNTEMVTSLASTQTMSGSGRAANAGQATSTRRSRFGSWVSRPILQQSCTRRGRGGRPERRGQGPASARAAQLRELPPKRLVPWARRAATAAVGRPGHARPSGSGCSPRSLSLEKLDHGPADHHQAARYGPRPRPYWTCCETLVPPPRRKLNHRSYSTRRERTSSTPGWRCAIVHMYHSTATAELTSQVTAHLRAGGRAGQHRTHRPARQQVLRNHSQATLLGQPLSLPRPARPRHRTRLLRHVARLGPRGRRSAP